jgi:hypothetical protein
MKGMECERYWELSGLLALTGPNFYPLGAQNAALQIAARALLFRGHGRSLLQIGRLFLSIQFLDEF